MSGIYIPERSRDDWIVEVWFRGLKTGKTIHKKVGVSYHAEEAFALHAGIAAVHHTLPRSGRVLRATIHRRHEVYPPSECTGEKLAAEAIAPYTKGRQ